MGASIYPQATDLSTFLTGTGLSSTIVSGFNLERAVRAGIQAFERDTGRRFLADKDPVTRTFDPPDMGTLIFDQDLTQLMTVAYQPEAATSETLVQDTDYRIGPENAPADGEPYRWLEFQRRWWRPLSIPYRGAMRITGRWGYGDEIPEDAFLGMIQGAAGWLFPGGHFRLTQGVQSYKEGDTSREFGPVKNILDAWQAAYDMTVSRYRRAGL